MGLSSNNNNKNQVMIKSSTIDGHDWTSRNPPKPGMKRQVQQSQRMAQSEPLKCPRCESSNTKFCYFNNYNKSQPRHFCRSCKRHWTNGGTLRNVPVGGVRKNKRPKKSSDDRHVALIPTDNNNDDDGKTASEILYQAMMTGPGPFKPAQPVLISPSPPPPQPAASGLLACPNYLSAASSPFDTSSLSSSVSNYSFQTTSSINNIGSGGGDYYGEDDQYMNKNLMNHIAPQPLWKQLVNSTSNNNNNNYNEGFGNYSWNFEDIDSLVSADHVHLPWESHYSLDILKP